MQGDPGAYNEGIETGAEVIGALVKRMQGRAEASQAAGFIAALEAVAIEIRDMKAPVLSPHYSPVSIGTPMSLARLDIRAATGAPDDDDYYRDRVYEPA